MSNHNIFIAWLLALFFQVSVKAQEPADSVIIELKTYVTDWAGGDRVSNTQKYAIMRHGRSYTFNGRKISNNLLLSPLYRQTEPGLTAFLFQQGVDTSKIRKRQSSLLQLYKDKKSFDWNEQQKVYIFSILGNVSRHTDALKQYVSYGSGYTMHHHYQYEYQVTAYTRGQVTIQLNSRKHREGFKMPWTDTTGKLIYDYEIERALAKILGEKSVPPPLRGQKLQAHLVNEIIKATRPELYRLAVHSYEKEIEELKTDFQVLSAEEYPYRGRYISDEPRVMRIALKNNSMLQNMRFIFFATVDKGRMYSRDSIKLNYRHYLERISRIPFITRYLIANPESTLDIYYFNNKAISDYQIDNVNKNAKEWAAHDRYLESLTWYEKSNIKPGFDIGEATSVSRQLHCGCNYRFNNSFLQQALFFEITNKEGDSSLWFLLPDNRSLLYLMQGEKVLDLKRSEFGEKGGLLYPCVMFDLEGRRLER